MLKGIFDNDDDDSVLGVDDGIAVNTVKLSEPNDANGALSNNQIR